MILSSAIIKNKIQCVVPENIHTPTPPHPLQPQRRATEIPRGGGVQKEAISEGLGGGALLTEVFSRGSE